MIIEVGRLSCAQAKQIDMVNYLAALEYHPSKIKKNDSYERKTKGFKQPVPLVGPGPERFPWTQWSRKEGEWERFSPAMDGSGRWIYRNTVTQQMSFKKEW